MLGSVFSYVCPKSLADSSMVEERRGVVLTSRVSGPVVIGENMRGCAMYELVRVGHDELVGGGFSSMP